MFKFNFFGEDVSEHGPDSTSNSESSAVFPVQEQNVFSNEEPFTETEVMPVTVGNITMRMLNGEHVAARMQQQGDAGNVSSARHKHSDLIPDVYEGGMKLWECAWDLIEYMATEVPTAKLHVVELGCGAALPAMHCMLRGAASITVQDYNSEVVSHLTVPNLRLNLSKEQLSRCRAFSGDWGCLARHITSSDQSQGLFRTADLVLSSETIYNPSSWPRLVEAIDATLKPDGFVLLAAKTFYFGVGGGTRSFETFVAEDGRFSVEVVWSTSQGLQREILRLRRS